MQDNEPVRRQGPRRKAGSEGIPEEQERKPRIEETTAPAVDADAAKRDAPRKKADGAGGVASADSKSSNSKVVLGAVSGLSLVIILAVVLIAGMNRDERVEMTDKHAEDTSSSSAQNPSNINEAELHVDLYCRDLPESRYEEGPNTIYDRCIKLVFGEIDEDAQRFIEASKYPQLGKVDYRAIQAVLGDAEDFMREQGYATTEPNVITNSSNYVRDPLILIDLSFAYCFNVGIDNDYAERDITTTCVDLVKEAIMDNESTFDSIVDEKGDIGVEDVEAVLGEPVNFLAEHGYTPVG